MVLTRIADARTTKASRTTVEVMVEVMTGTLMMIDVTAVTGVMMIGVSGAEMMIIGVIAVMMMLVIAATMVAEIAAIMMDNAVMIAVRGVVKYMVEHRHLMSMSLVRFVKFMVTQRVTVGGATMKMMVIMVTRVLLLHPMALTQIGTLIHEPMII
jgi:hypothetical protein